MIPQEELEVAPADAHARDMRYGEAIAIAPIAGVLTCGLVGLLEYWLLRPHFVGALSIPERLQLFPHREVVAMSDAWHYGWTCGLAVTIGILLLVFVRSTPERRFDERLPRILLGYLYGFIAGFWLVARKDGDLSDRMLGMFRYVPTVEDQLAGLGPPLCGIICSLMVGIHLSILFRKPTSAETSLSNADPPPT